MEKLRRASDLMRQGFSFLDEHRYTDALKVGQKLKKLHHSSAFEILALAYLRSDKLSKAIVVLEEGVAKAGLVWILWELLGNCYSDAGRYTRAEKAYQKALRLEGCDHDVVHLNRAIAFNRAGKHQEAKYVLRLVKSPRLRRRADACRIRTALKLKDIRSGRRLALRLAQTRPMRKENYDRESESEIYLSCALALSGNLTTKKALRFAFRAVEMQPNNTEALGLIRTMLQRKTSDLFLFRLLIHGLWNVPIDKSSMLPGFFRTVDVAATNEQAALWHAKSFFPYAVRKTLSVEESKTLNNPALELEGVYFLSGYAFYSRRKRRRSPNSPSSS